MRKQTLITIVFAILCLGCLFGLPRTEDDRAVGDLAICYGIGNLLGHSGFLILHQVHRRPIEIASTSDFRIYSRDQLLLLNLHFLLCRFPSIKADDSGHIPNRHKFSPLKQVRRIDGTFEDSYYARDGESISA